MMNSVLDHHLAMNIKNDYYQYGKEPVGVQPGGADGIIVDFAGEQANGGVFMDNGVPCIGIGGTFLLTSPVTSLPMVRNPGGCSKAGYASYDEHPGYDYHAAKGTPVYAVASGTVVDSLDGICIIANTGCTCKAWGYIGIDHGNGYVSQYGHLSVIASQAGIAWQPGAHVNKGDQIDESGTTGADINNKCAPLAVPQHLHFEMLKRLPGKPPNNYRGLNYAVVDPYGWTGTGVYGFDPLFAIYGIPSVKLWQ